METAERTVGPHPPVPRWLVEVLLAAVVIVFALAPFPDPWLLPHGPLSWSIAVLPVLLLPWRRRWPYGVFGALLALYALGAAGGALLPGLGFAITVAVFHLAHRTTRRISLVVAGSAASVMVALTALAAIVYGYEAHMFQIFVTVAFAAAAGDATRSRREYLLAVMERAERAEQTRESEARRRVADERLRIARDLHDTVAHQISVISLNAGVASSAMETRPHTAEEALGRIRTASRTVLGEIGDLMRYLRAEENGAGAGPIAPHQGLDGLDGLLGSFTETGLAVTVRTEGDLSAVAGTTDLVAYRVIQEGLTNAHKHGTEHRAHLLVTADDGALSLVITNPAPAGLVDIEGESARIGHGLVGLRERVALAQGTVETGLTASGHRLAVTLPLPTTGEGVL